MQWLKLGRLYCPPESGQHPKLHSHAANPLPVHLADDTYRVFFSGRDIHNRSSVGAVDIDIVERHIVQEHHDPFFEHGPLGSFYQDGVSIGNCYSVAGRQYMLFMGWQTPSGSHWRGDIGRLIVETNATLTLDREAPFLSCDATDLVSLSYPWVHQDASGDYKMWYGSTRSWDAGNGEMLHVINSASSHNGDDWHREGLAVPFSLGVAQAFSRPTVRLTASGGLDMWFSYRSGNGEAYRIGLARSANGAQWVLALGQSGIDLSKSGWDSEMIEYPFVFDHKGQTYMLYNGNGFGKTGFGLAVLTNG